jgi:hypothetical protein
MERAATPASLMTLSDEITSVIWLGQDFYKCLADKILLKFFAIRLIVCQKKRKHFHLQIFLNSDICIKTKIKYFNHLSLIN